MPGSPKFMRIVWPLAAAQMLTWAGAFYLFPALLGHWEREFGWSKQELTGAFTLALLLSAVVSPVVGRAIDRGLSLYVYPTSALLASLFLAGLGWVHELWQFYTLWAVLGIVMGGALYEPCFAILTRHMGGRARQAITLVTLLAGFAGSIAFPTAHALVGEVGWRGVCIAFAAIIACVAVPLNFYAVAQAESANPAPPEPPAPNTGKRMAEAFRPVLWLLGLAFAAIAFDHGALIAHLLTILDARGVAPDVAVLAAAMIGPMQVTGRLAMMAAERHMRAVSVALAAFALLGLAALSLFGVGGLDGKGDGATLMLLVGFVLFQGAGFGVLSILRPILIAELLGRRRFGAIAGFLAVPFLAAFALAPSVAGWIWGWAGYDGVIWAAGAAAVVGFVALMLAAKRATDIGDDLQPET
ncbi:MAG: MFS transporter [Rhodospirillaceae bacterium]